MKKLYALLALTLSMPTLAQVQLLVDENIKVTAINGKEVKHGALQPLRREFSLDAGRHVISARYDRLFDLTRGEHDYVKSGNVTVTADLADNQTYHLTMPNQPNTHKEAKEYAKSPTLAITQNNNIIITQEKSDGSQAGLLSSLGGLFGRDNVAVIDNQQAIAAITPSAPTPTTKDNLDGFMQLWLNASPEEREKIRQWIEK